MATRRMTMQLLEALHDYSVFMTVIFLALLLKHILSMAERLSSSLEMKAGVRFGPDQSEQEPCWFEAARANVCSQDMEMEKAEPFTETCFHHNISDQAPSLLQQNNTPKYVSITSDDCSKFISGVHSSLDPRQREIQLTIRLNSDTLNAQQQSAADDDTDCFWTLGAGRTERALTLFTCIFYQNACYKAC